MQTLDLIVAAGFVVIVLVAGLAFMRLSGEGDADGFFSAGGVVPWWLSGISLYMSFFSVGTFVVWGSIAYSSGFVAIAIQSTMCIAGLIIGMLVAPKWNRTHVTTAAEFIGHRLGDKARTTYTLLFLITSIIGMGALLYPVGVIVEVATGIDVTTAILLLSAFIVLYAAVGGLWAVLVTDLLQFVVLSVSILIIVPLALMQVGGLDGFVAGAPDGFFRLTDSEYTWGFLAAFLVYNTIFIGGHWGYVQRYTTVRNPGEARKVAWLFAALYSLSPLIWMLPPMIYRVINPDLEGLGNEGAYMLMSQAVLPAGLLGLMLVSMVFATASSVNTVLNISAAVFTKDVWAALKPETGQHRLLQIGRWVTGIFGLLAVASALMVESFGGIVQMVLSIAAIVGGSLFLPPLWALFSRRQTAVSVLSATFIALGVNLWLNFVVPQMGGEPPSRALQMVIGVSVPVAILALFEIVFLLRGREDQRMAHYDAASTRLSEARSYLVRQSDAGNVDHQANAIIAASVLAIGAVIAGVGLFAGDAALMVTGIGLAIALAALVFLLRARKQQAG